jgi:hypothetical protein
MSWTAAWYELGLITIVFGLSAFIVWYFVKGDGDRES